MNGQQDAINNMAFLGIGLAVISVFILTGTIPVLQGSQNIISNVLHALGIQ